MKRQKENSFKRWQNYFWGNPPNKTDKYLNADRTMLKNPRKLILRNVISAITNL